MKKSPLDSMFDVAESMLGGMESALQPAKEDEAIDAEFTEQRSDEWEALHESPLKKLKRLALEACDIATTQNLNDEDRARVATIRKEVAGA